MLTSQGNEKEQKTHLAVDDLLCEFEKALIDTLKAPEKNVIFTLTSMLESYLSHKDSVAVCLNICKIVERRLNEVQVNKKLAHLYLMDSIVKNLKHSMYPKLFSVNLVANFTGVFRKVDEKMRKKLFELRKTWSEHFTQALLTSLDLAVKEIDPAWPVLAQAATGPQAQETQPVADQNGRKRSHPPDSPDSTTTAHSTSSSSSNCGAVGAAETQRKRPALSAAISVAASGPSDFVIDTVGDPKVEAMAAKAGRQQQQPPQQQQQADVDMRSGWSQYKRSSHGRQLSGDVDMRHFQTDSSQHQVEMITQQQAQIRRMLASASLKPETRQQLLGTLQTLANELDEAVNAQQQRQPTHPQQQQQQQQQLQPPQSSSQIPQHVDNLLDALLNGSADSYQPALPPPQSLPLHQQQPHHQQFPMRPQQRQQKDSFRWRVNIPGLPEFPQIGCDPRLLTPLNDRFEASRNIQVDGEIRQVVLDRIQPLLILEDEPHAVRFKMPPGGKILLRVDAHQPVELRINTWTKVFFGLRPHIVCLGGPFHELIVGGRPYNVPFNDQNPVDIVLGKSRGLGVQGAAGSGGTFGVRLQALLPNSNRQVTPSLDICPPIPRSVLRWANEGAFGSAQLLHMTPFNPEDQASLPQHLRQPQAALPAEDSQAPVPMLSMAPPLPPPLQPPQEQQQPLAPAAGPASVFEVFQNLIRAGIIKKTKAEDVPEPVLTGFVGIDKPLPMIPKRLYDGYQCPQCGLRFNGEEAPECRAHMDWHFQRRAALFGLTIRSRMWFPHWTALVKGEESLDATGLPSGSAISASSSAGHSSASAGDAGAKKDHQQLSRVPAFPEPSRNICGVCFETFENRWDDEAEDWMLQDCVRLPDGGIYHPICAEDAGKVKLDETEALDEEERATSDEERETSAGESEVLKPEVEEPIPESEVLKPEVEEPMPESEVLKPEVEESMAESEALEPEAEESMPVSEALKPEAEEPMPKSEALKPEAEESMAESEALKPEPNFSPDEIRPEEID